MELYVALSIISIVIALTLIVQIRKRFSEKNSYMYFTWVMFAAVLWTFFAMLEVVCVTQEFKIVFSKLSYIGIVSVPVLWLFFSYEYAGKENKLKQPWTIYLWVIPSITLLLVMTNEWHGLIWTKIYKEVQTEAMVVLRYERGVAFAVNALYGYALTTVGIIHIFITLQKTKTLKDHFIVILGATAPLVGNGLYLTRNLHFDYAPAAFAFMCICFAWAIISGFFDKKMAIAETIYNHLDEAIILMNEKHCIVGMNPCARKIFNLKDTEVIFSAESILPFGEKLKVALTQQKDSFFEVCLAQEGVSKWFLVHHYMIGNHSRYSGWIISMVDITEKKCYVEELEKGKIAAEAANIAKSQFLANISHEIRTPLNGMMGFTELLSYTDLTKEQGDYIHEINQASQLLLQLVNEVLDFSKIEADKMDLESITFSLLELADQVIALATPGALKKKLLVFYTIEESVCHQLKGDPIRLKQVLNNLIGNGVKFTEKGQVKLAISLLKDTQKDVLLQFEVSDTGIGIDEKDKNKLFEVFTQADSSTTRKYGGTGLGLAISKKIIELMGGEIWVESEIGRGARFIFNVPFEKQQNSQMEEKRSLLNGDIKDQEVVDRKPYHILLAEDTAANRKLTLIMLGKLGYTCDSVVNGQEAVAACNTQPFDLILMDCQMPVMDGYLAAHCIRTSENCNRKTPIIAMTANVLEKDLERCLEVGMEEHISKPITQQKLRAITQKYLKSY